MTDHWKVVERKRTWHEVTEDTPSQRVYFADLVDAARAKDAEAHAAALAAKDAEIATLRAQVQADAHLRSIVDLYRADPLAMADALWRMREELGRLKEPRGAA